MMCDVSSPSPSQFSVSTAGVILLGGIAACAFAIAIAYTFAGSSKQSAAGTSSAATPPSPAPARSAPALDGEFAVDTE